LCEPSHMRCLIIAELYPAVGQLCRILPDYTRTWHEMQRRRWCKLQEIDLSECLMRGVLSATL
jgi:hypothetical protein